MPETPKYRICPACDGTSCSVVAACSSDPWGVVSCDGCGLPDLRKRGGVSIRVPNYGSLNRRVTGKKRGGFRSPDHVNYFTLQSLRDIASRAGFIVELVNKITLAVDDNVSVLLRKNPIPN